MEDKNYADHLCKRSEIESITKENNKVLRQLRHKRFRLMNDISSSLSCKWYAQAKRSLVPTGIENNDDHLRPDYVHT